MGAPQYEQAGADIGGTGTTNTIPRWTGASTLGDSIIIQGSTANAIGIGNAPTTDLAGYKALEVGGLGSGFVNADNDLWITANAKHSGGGWKYAVAASTPSNSIRANAGAIIFNRAGNGTAGNALTWLESARIDASGNVGIGTASPGDRLQIGAPTGTAPFGIIIGENYGAASQRARLAFGDANRGIGLTSGDNVLIHTFNTNSILFGHGSTTSFTERARIDSSGNFGIGVIPSAWASSVRAEEMRTHARWNYNSGSDSVAYWTVNAFLNSAGNAIYKATAAASQYTQIGGAHVWERAVSGTAGNTVTWLESARIDATGNFGIATSTMVAPGLTVTDPTNVNNIARANLRNNNSDVGNRIATVGYNGNTIQLFTASESTGTANNTLAFFAYNLTSFYTGTTVSNPQERMRIDSTGNVGIGTGAATTTPAATGSLVIGQNNVSQQWAARIYGGNDANRAPVLSLFRAGNTEGIIAEIKNGAVGALALGITGGVANFNDATLSAACQVQITSTLMDISGASYGLKLPATPGNPDTQTLDCYQETTLSSGFTTSGITSTGTFTVTARATRIGRSIALTVKITPSGGASLTFASGWYVTLTGIPQMPDIAAFAAISNDATGARGSIFCDAAATPTIYGGTAGAYALGTNISLLVSGIVT